MARDAARSRIAEHVERALRDLQPERIALQRQRHDFGGTLTDAEYAGSSTTLEKSRATEDAGARVAVADRDATTTAESM